MALAGLGSRVFFGLRLREEPRPLPSSSPDASAVRAASRGDKGAFAGLVESHKRAVYGLCLRLLGNGEEARDAAQETFVRAYAALHAFDASQPFAPWLLRIARNFCLDQLRRRLPEGRQVSLDAEPGGDDPPRREIADPDAVRADEALERSQTRASLELAVASLPPNYREVVHLFHVEHLSYREIASAMDVPIGTVMTWLHRARARLREALAATEVAS